MPTLCHVPDYTVFLKVIPLTVLKSTQFSSLFTKLCIQSRTLQNLMAHVYLALIYLFLIMSNVERLVKFILSFLFMFL